MMIHHWKKKLKKNLQILNHDQGVLLLFGRNLYIINYEININI